MTLKTQRHRGHCDFFLWHARNCRFKILRWLRLHGRRVLGRTRRRAPARAPHLLGRHMRRTPTATRCRGRSAGASARRGGTTVRSQTPPSTPASPATSRGCRGGTSSTSTSKTSWTMSCCTGGSSTSAPTPTSDPSFTRGS